VENNVKYFNKQQLKVIDSVQSRYKHLSIRKQAELLTNNSAFADLTYEAIRSRLMKLAKHDYQFNVVEVDEDIFESIDDIPEGNDEDPLIYEVDGDAGVLCDVHAPYHSKHALMTAISVLQDVNLKYIILNGDFLDFKSLGRFGKKVSEWDLNEEIKVGNKILDYLCNRFSNIIYRIGNHEVWLEKYINKEAPAFANLEALAIQNLLHFKERGIRVVGFKDTIKIGDLNIIHGHEIPAGGSINAARNKLIHSFTNLLFGHHHYTSNIVSNVAFSNKFIGVWGVGCLRNLHPEWRISPQWNHGFAWVKLLKNGDFEVFNRRIMNGRVIE